MLLPKRQLARFLRRSSTAPHFRTHWLAATICLRESHTPFDQGHVHLELLELFDRNRLPLWPGRPAGRVSEVERLFRLTIRLQEGLRRRLAAHYRTARRRVDVTVAVELRRRAVSSSLGKVRHPHRSRSARLKGKRLGGGFAFSASGLVSSSSTSTSLS
jgi:hypothetical protein